MPVFGVVRLKRGKDRSQFLRTELDQTTTMQMPRASAAARRRRNDLRIVGDAVALNSEDHKDKGKEVAQKGHAPQSHEEQPAQKPKSTQP